MTSGVYAIVQEGSGRRYVGQAKDVRTRGRDHRSALRAGRHENPRLQNAWNKYGEEAFRFELLEEVPLEGLTEREQAHMNFGAWFNICPAAGSTAGRSLSPEHRKKIGAAHKGSRRSDSARARMAEAHRYRWIRNRERLTAAMRGKLAGVPLSEEHRAALRRGWIKRKARSL